MTGHPKISIYTAQACALERSLQCRCSQRQNQYGRQQLRVISSDQLMQVQVVRTVSDGWRDHRVPPDSYRPPQARQPRPVRCKPTTVCLPRWVLEAPLHKLVASLVSPSVSKRPTLLGQDVASMPSISIATTLEVLEDFTYLQSWTKVLGHFCVGGAFSNSHKSNPSPHPHKQRWTRVQNFFRVSTLYSQGKGRENCKKISKMMHCFKREPRNDRKIRILQYCPKDFCPGLQAPTSPSTLPRH